MAVLLEQEEANYQRSGSLVDDERDGMSATFFAYIFLLITMLPCTRQTTRLVYY